MAAIFDDDDFTSDDADGFIDKQTITIDDPIGYVIDVILKEAKQEDRLVRQLLYVMLSAKTNNPFNLAINAPTGEGKNWVLDKVAAVFPEEDVIKLHYASDKALFHESGDLVIKASDIDFNAFNLELDESELDDFGYYLLSYVTGQIEKKGNELLGREEKGSDSHKELVNEINEDMKHLYHFAKKLIDLQHKILIFLDTPRMSLISALMPLLSHDSYESEYKYVDTSGPIKTYKNLLRGWPSFIFAQAIDYSKHERWPEVQRRFIITNPTMDSKKKYEEAIHLIVQKHCLPDFMYQKLVVSDQEKQRAKEIIAFISKKILDACAHLRPGENNTFVPYSEMLDNVLSKEQTSDMTAAKRFNAFLSLLPLVNIHKRPYILLHIDKQDGNGPIAHKVPLATFDDLKYAMYIMQFSNGVRPYVLQWFYEVFHACYKIHDKPSYKNKIVGKYEQRIEESRIGVTVDELIAETKSKKGKAYTSKQLHEGFVYPLMNQGYIDSVGSEIDHRKNIYFPTLNITLTDENQSENIVFSTKSDERQNTYEDCKVNLRDSTTLPNKQYIMSKLMGVLESSSESHIDVTFYDQEGNDIQIETLVDRYYQNPENYFGYPPVDIFNDIQNRPSDDNLKKGQNGDVSQEIMKKL